MFGVDFIYVVKDQWTCSIVKSLEVVCDDKYKQNAHSV